MITFGHVLDVIALLAVSAFLWLDRHPILERLGIRGGSSDVASVAQDTYSAADKIAGRILHRHIPAAGADAAKRAELLGDLSFLTRLAAETHLVKEGSRDLYESEKIAADLARLVADTEHRLAGTLSADDEATCRGAHIYLLFGEDYDSTRFSDLAGRLGVTGDLVERYRLMRLMWGEANPVFGGWAAEMLASIGHAYLAAAGWTPAAIHAEINDQYWTLDDPAEIAARDLVGATALAEGTIR